MAVRRQLGAPVARGLEELLERDRPAVAVHRVRRQPAQAARCPGVLGREGEELFGQGVGGLHHGLAGHHRPGRAEGSGVVPDDVGVGLPDGDPASRGAERAGGDLLVHGGRAVAELRRADRDVVRAVLQQLHPGVGEVAAGRAGGDHRHRGALPGQPALGDVLGAAVGRDRVADDPQALVEAVAGDVQVLLLAAGADHVLAGADDVALPEDQRVDAEAPGQLVQRRLHGEGHLPQAVAAERPGRHAVGVDGVRVHLLVRRPVDGHRLAHAVEHHRRAVVAVRAGVGDHPQLERRQRAVRLRPHLDADPERVPGGGAVELLGAGELQLHRALQAHRGEHHDVLGEHLLLAAEAAADPARDHPDVLLRQVVQRAQCTPGQERHLGAGADHDPLPALVVVLEVRDRAVRLQAGVLHALGAEALLVDQVGLGEALLDAADLAVHLADHVVGRARDPRLRALGVEHRGAGGHREFGVEDVRQHLVLDDDPPAALLGGALAVGDHRRHPLSGEAHHVVQHPGVVRVLGRVLVPGRGEQPLRGVVVGQHQVDAGHPQGGRGVDGEDPGVRVRGAQQLHVQQPLDLDVEGVAGGAGDDLRAGGSAEAAADGLPGARLLRVPDPAQRVLDRPVAGAAAQVSLQRLRQVGELPFVQGRGGHQEAGRAEAALEALRVQEPLLHRVQFAVLGQPLDGGHGPALGAYGRVQAAVYGFAVHLDGAGAAVARVAALLHPEPAALAQVRPQALPRARLGVERLVVDPDREAHRPASSVSSRRICSAKWKVMCRRQAGSPWMSS